MAPPTSEFFPTGVDLALFVQLNEMRLSDKFLNYIIKANVKSDNQVYTIGKSSSGTARLTSYVHTDGCVSKKGPHRHNTHTHTHRHTHTHTYTHSHTNTYFVHADTLHQIDFIRCKQ